MKMRKKMSRRSSRKNFKRGANKTHIKNTPRTVMRGGLRL